MVFATIAAAADAQASIFAPSDSANAWAARLVEIIGEARDLTVGGDPEPLGSYARLRAR